MRFFGGVEHDTPDIREKDMAINALMSQLMMLAAAQVTPAQGTAAIQAATSIPPETIMPSLPGWMSGCWMAERSDSRTEECWTVPRGTMMLGSSHSFNGAVTRSFEHMRIVQEDGRLIFIAQPDGAEPTRFDLEVNISGGETERLTFINRQNDYPQQISYRFDRNRPNEMSAEIAMIDGSRKVSWIFRRPS